MKDRIIDQLGISLSVHSTEDLERLEEIYDGMLSVLLNTWDGETFYMSSGLINRILDVCEKATGKTWDEIWEILDER